MKSLLLLAVFSLGAIQGKPYNGYIPRTVMFGGYYGGQGLTRGTPQGTGTLSFSAGDTIATNTYFGEQYPEFPNSDEETKGQEESLEEPITPKRKPPPKRRDDEDDGEDDLPGSWPLQGGRGRNGMPSYNAFFPIVFGGSGGGPKIRSGDEGYYPGGSTAIANSFSTGKGGVATSHATSFGDPYAAGVFRGGFGNRRGGAGKEE